MPEGHLEVLAAAAPRPQTKPRSKRGAKANSADAATSSAAANPNVEVYEVDHLVAYTRAGLTWPPPEMPGAFLAKIGNLTERQT